MEWIGYIAAVLTTVAFVPQAWKVRQTRRTEDLSLALFSLFSTGVFCWLIYGIIIEDVPVIAANIVTLILALYILSWKIRNLKVEKERV